MKRIGAIFMAAVMMMILCSCGNHGTGQDRGSTDNNGQAETRLEERDVTEGLGEDDTENPAAASLPEEFVLVQGGTFQMGSPEEEAWRSEDEVLHMVTVSDFYMSAYELTQAEYQEITGENPSSFSGEDLPVENISWLDAVSYCNTRSEREGLTPAYTVEGSDVTWDRGADGYRLPTEAEWEYACRAGTTTPFNMEEYDTVILGFPNWWASIPMPIASFLEEYDFSGKTIIPFCSHGGGRFGQSLTAIAKLVPDARMGEALSVHYSGGSDLPDEITEWLKTNGIIK